MYVDQVAKYFYQQREFNEAWTRAVASAADSADRKRQAYGELIKGRICFEFGQYREAAGHLGIAVGRYRQQASQATAFYSRQSHAVADYAAILITKCALAEPGGLPSTQVADLETNVAKRCLDLIQSDFVAEGVYNSRKDDLVFDSRTSSELLIEQLRAHRRAVRSARSLHDSDMYEETEREARKFYANVGSALGQPIADETSSQTGPLGERFSRYVGIVPFRVTYEYLLAGLKYDCGELKHSLDLFEQFLEQLYAKGHVAARIGHVRAARKFGCDVTALCADYDAGLAAEEFVGRTASGGKIGFVHVERALLKWTRASNASTFRPEEAIRLCDQADQVIASYFDGRSISKYEEVPRWQSNSVIGYHLARGDKNEALRLAATFLTDWHLGDLTKFLSFRSAELGDAEADGNGPGGRLKVELIRSIGNLPRTAAFPFVFRARAHASLLVIPDLLRAIGRLPEALAWLEAILHSLVVEIDDRQHANPNLPQRPSAPLGPSLRHAESDQSMARLMSLLNLIGLHAEAGRVKEVLPQTRSRAVEREVALSYLGEWKFYEAEKIFGQLMVDEREDVAVWGLNGLIDRARRHKCDAVPLTKEWVAMFSEGRSELSPAAEAAIVIARGWVELQHGDPERGLWEFVKGLGKAPYDGSGWIGMVRCLRVLGRHKEAIRLLDWLREPDRLSIPRQLRPEVMKGSISDLADIARGVHLRYLQLLAVERGWCYIDIDEFELARESFEVATERAPYMMSGQRGRLAAMVTLQPSQVDQVLAEIVAEAEDWMAGAHVNSGEFSERLRNDLLIEGGRLMSRLGHYTKADDLFDEHQRRRAPVGPGDTARRSQLRLLRIAEAHLDADRRAEARRILAIFDDNEQLIAKQNAANRDVRGVDRQPTLTLESSSGVDRVVRLFRVRWLLADRNQEEALSETNELISTSHAHDSSGEHHHNEHLAVAKLIVLFEHRKYNEALKLANKNAPNTGDDVLGSDIRRIIAAWSALALAELEPPRSNSRLRYIETAEKSLKESDRTSVDEIHLAAILRALRNGPIGRYRPSEPGKRRETRPVTTEIMTAIGELDRALRRRPYSGSIRRDKAALLIALDRLDEASYELEQARLTTIGGARIDLLTGVIAYKQSQFEESIRWFRQAVDQDPRDHIHHRALAVAYFANGQPRDALAAITNGIKSLWPDANEARRQLEATAIQLLGLRLRQLKPRTRFLQLRQFLTPELNEILESHRRHERVLSDREADTVLALAEIDRVIGRLNRARTRQAAVRRWDPGHPGLAGIQEPTPESQFDLARWRNRFIWLFMISTIIIFGVVVAEAARNELPAWIGTTAANLADNTQILLLLGPVAFGIAFLVSLFEPRFTSLRVASVFEATLETSDPVPEIVHVDLDMSVSRLLVVSGFSHFRPEVRNLFHDDGSLFGQ